MMKNRFDDDGKTFIHFGNKDLCNQFKIQYKGNLGHTCCNGKGCLLFDVNNKEMHEMKKRFLKENQLQGNTG